MNDPMVEPQGATGQLLDIPAERTVTMQEDSEWLRQLSLIYGGLILIGVYMVQPFLTAASLDLSAMVCVVAVSVAIPLLAALVLVNRQEAFRRRATPSVLATIARVIAQNLAFVGVVAGFWHIHWIAGVGMLAGGIVGRGFTREGPRAWSRARSLRLRKATNPATPRHSPSKAKRARCGWAAPGQPTCQSHQRSHFDQGDI